MPRLCPGLILALLLLAAWPAGAANQAAGQTVDGYAGSGSCRDCHARFYDLWSTSRHGLTMRPYTADFAAMALTPQTAAIAIGPRNYQAHVGAGEGFVREFGPEGERRYAMVQALGGKNVFYFLTELDRGRLQTLPVAYDVVKREWFDLAASGLRHHPEQGGPSPRRIDWRDPAFTFNASCHGCHVSQLETNYDPATDSYRTTWAEPGINCETCHGPARAHNEACAKAPRDVPPSDLRILRSRDLTVDQRNDACASCHAKFTPITASFVPGERFLDHFDLALLEHPDYYPDGRDLGENFTQTSWLLSPCQRNGRFDCVFCHSSSGRFKQRKDPDQACLPCHADKARDVSAHTRHKPESAGSRCLSCHMPQTTFARMVRTDHSMRPPSPVLTQRFGSPNACQGCHKDKDAAWADATVRAWRSRDYQAPEISRAALVDQARRRDWTGLSAMLEYVADSRHDPVFAASLLRLLRACPESRKWPVTRDALHDPSPLVRAAAAQGLAEARDAQSFPALARAAADPVRLVRVRAAEALAGRPLEGLDAGDRAAVARATAELLASFDVRPDDWAGRYNLGNDRLRRGDLPGALAAYDQAARLRPDAAAPRINAAMAKARLQDLAGAEALLREAGTVDPQNAVAAFNLGLVLAEQGKTVAAKTALESALSLDPALAEAAYNLGLLLLREDPAAGLDRLRQAAALQPHNPKFAYAVGLYEAQESASPQARQP